MTHEPTIRRVDAWHWRAFCTCGYRSKHWDTRAEADKAVRTHMAREAQARRRQERREHRTALTPMRYV